MSKKMKNMLRSLFAAIVLTLICSTAALADENDPTRFVKDTMINGVNVGGMTVDEAKTLIGNAYSGSYKLTIKAKGNITEAISGPEIAFAAIVPDELGAILDKQNAAGRITGPRAGNTHELQIGGAFDENAMKLRIDMLASVSGADVVKTEDARVSGYQEGQPFTILPAVQGNDVDTEALLTVLRGAVSIGLKEISLEEWNCYRTVQVTEDNEQLKLLCATMNQIKDMTITYTFGDASEQLPGAAIASWLTGSVDGQIGVNQDLAAAYVATLAAKYDTVGTARTLRSSSGRDVTVQGSYGWKINQEAETAALISMIKTGQTQAREPQYANSAVSRTGADWGNTYVEIDLSGQHVYMIKDGVLVWDAPCVTGNVSKNYTTPPGIFTLYYKERDRVLRGPKQADGTYEYESPVDYWMPFNGGIGLHDANWRSKFGGSIYQYGGSHGCINLPPAKAKVLYDLVYKGIPILCYN